MDRQFCSSKNKLHVCTDLSDPGRGPGPTPDAETPDADRGDAREQPGLKEIIRPLQFEDIVRVVSKHKSENWEEYVRRRGDWGRDMVLLLARSNTMMTNRELAERAGGIDDSAVAHAVRRLTKRIAENAGLERAFRILQKEIAQMS